MRTTSDPSIGLPLSLTLDELKAGYNIVDVL